MKKRLEFRSVVALVNRKLPVRFAAILLASSTLVSALLGIFRDRLLNSYYLDTYPTGIDAYTAAFTVPDFMFFILVSGALAVTFIPVFNQRLATGNKKSTWELSSSILNLMALATLVASILIMIFADPLVRYVVAPGLNESAMALAINMMRVIAINPFLFAIATVLSSIQQAVGRFVFYALAPALYNVGIIIGIVWFTNGINIFGVQIFEGGIMGVALGVVLGAVLQVIVSLIGLFGLGFDYNFRINWKNQGFRAVLRLLPARSFDQGLDYVNTIVNTNLASRMGSGVIRSYQQASTLRQMPVSLIGVAISTAFFPQMTEELATADEEAFRRTVRTALRMIMFLALPVAVIAYFARGYVVNFIKNGGDAMIAAIFGASVVMIFASSVYHIASRCFYARQNTRTPFLVSLIAVGINISLAVTFSTVFKWGPEGLAYASTAATVVEVTILLTILQVKSKWLLLNAHFWRGFLRMIIAAVIGGCVAYSMTKFFPLRDSDDSFFVTFPKFCLIAASGLVAYGIAAYCFGLEEVRPVVNGLKRIVFRNTK
jgi:putative peptidoglycan lipid II flippase